MKQNITILIALLFSICISAYGQKYSELTLRSTLDSISKQQVGLNNELQLNVSGLQLSELLNSVALENNLNFSVDPSLNQMISYNFYQAPVKDLLVFLYLNYEIEFDFVGSIISVRKRTRAPEKKQNNSRRDIKYNAANTFLSLDLKDDTLWRASEEITKLSGTNIVLDPEVRNLKVNAYLLNRPIDQVLEMFASSNGLMLEKQDDYFRLSKNDVEPASSGRPGSSGSSYSNGNRRNLRIKKNAIGTIDVSARNVSLNDLVQAAADELDVHYVLYSDLVGSVNLELTDVRFNELINKVFQGTNYSIADNEGVFVIGEGKRDGIRSTKLIQLENRTIESVKDAIPKEMLEGLNVNEFVELNALIVTGSLSKIEQLKEFVESIDVVVPMVQIDVMLLFSAKGSAIKTGIKAGIKDTPTETQGEVFPGLDMELGSQSINNILDALSGFGVVNLGQVTENFYVSLQALESNNIIQIESTPKLSTLNGHEANISIGETTYYQETQVNVQTSVTNQGVLQSQQWKSVDADLSVSIKPFVSTDEHVTLTITVEQDDFSGKADLTSPPNISTQTFESVVRVKNGEVILLGGLDKKEKSDTGSGVPFLSRIPVLKWFFSSREKEKEKSKLHVLIRPTVTY